ncbi:MAG: hypothetical protein ABI591_17175 [Kofleriaceae bacterium]
MRILVASFVAPFVASLGIVAACGSAPKKSSDIVTEGSNTPPTCCCKTIPVTDDKEIQPQFAMSGRMECSSANGDCVDDIQCNGAKPAGTTNSEGVPPPPPITPAATDSNAPIQ